MTDRIRIFLAEDVVIFREGLRLLLEQVPDFEVVGSAGDGISAVAKISEMRPAIVLLDLGLPGLNGIEVVRKIREMDIAIRVLMLTSHDSEEEILAALDAGADGYCVKQSAHDQLESAINAVVRGDGWIDPTIASRILKGTARAGSGGSKKGSRYSLSEREIEVLHLLVEGLSNQQMADRLILSPETIKSHLRRIMDKLVVSDRTQVAVKALREGLI